MTTEQLRPPTLEEIADRAQIVQGWRDLRFELRRKLPNENMYAGYSLAAVRQERIAAQKEVDQLRAQLDAAEAKHAYLNAAHREYEATADLLSLTMGLAPEPLEAGA